MSFIGIKSILRDIWQPSATPMIKIGSNSLLTFRHIFNFRTIIAGYLQYLTTSLTWHDSHDYPRLWQSIVFIGSLDIGLSFVISVISFPDIFIFVIVPRKITKILTSQHKSLQDVDTEIIHKFWIITSTPLTKILNGVIDTVLNIQKNKRINKRS